MINTGCNVEDIGLSLSPTAYFAQFNLNTDAVAMVTASHNENGWTGIKMGIEKGLTHSPTEMNELKEIVLEKRFTEGKGSYKEIKGFKEIGCQVIELDCNLDYNFPKYNPNPEDLKMLKAISNSVKENKADVGFGFDGDGDRVGVIDNNGHEIYSDKVGLIIARNLAPNHKNQKFVIDVKSTSLFAKDKILLENNCKTIYWKTGHSHIKRKVNELNALAGFEKSGHFFFNKPLGYGYDDGINSAIQVCSILDRENKKISDIMNEIPKTYQTPTMAPFCKDEKKYKVVKSLTTEVENLKANNIKIDDQKI